MMQATKVPAWLASWLERDAAGWRANDVSAYADAFAEDARYHTSPFDPPLEGREAILSYIAGNLGEQQDVDYRYEVLAVSGRTAIMHWRAAYLLPEQQLRQRLDGVSIYEFDAAGRVACHREWTTMRDEAAEGSDG